MRHAHKSEVTLDVTIISHVSPACPPRPCSNPDSPAYSDPGDPGERSIEAVLAFNPQTGQDMDITDLFSDKALELLAEEAYDDAMDRLDETP